jgi:23S rRNA (adenine2503-C2)-methyltransferase
VKKLLFSLNRKKYLQTKSKTLPLLGASRTDFEQLLHRLGEPPYRGRQIMQWVHQKKVFDVSKMTNLSKTLQEKLSPLMHVALPKVERELISDDGTIKWLINLPDQGVIETVFIPQRSRGTLCVSSQIGCALNCSFCATGKQGFNRNLSTEEIIGQLWLATSRLEALGRQQKVTNVVFMGMGEPLLNERAVIDACNLMIDDYGYGLSKLKVTVSTSGFVPAMQRLSEQTPVALAVSLHAPTDELRNELVPLNKKYPLDELMACCANYFPKDSKRKVTFEYVMLAGVNDSKACAKDLVRCVSGVPCKINLIPFNSFPNSGYQCSDTMTMSAFKAILEQAGICTTIRLTRGQDVDAACGQLAGQGKIVDLTYRTESGKKIKAQRRQERNN